MKVSTKGQVTIPFDIRNKLGLLPHTEILMKTKGTQVIIEKKAGTVSRGQYVLNRMVGKASVKMSTDEIMKITRS
ncbi:MAG: AbrB family transcriptional regulator [Rickettsiales bacterium]|nr:MAG: AbrB family transcriptional regulator [Rickettsiales bacterium]